MEKTHLKIKYKIKVKIMLLSVFAFVLAGCGQKEELEIYKTNMNQFFENIRLIDSSINAIDPNSETSTAELLSLLDSMDTSFAQMAALEVPDGFPGVDELADDASAYMSEAVSYYHQAYEGEYDASYADVAYQNYEQANIRFQYIVSIIHGNIPEEIFTYDDDGADESNQANEDTSEDNTENPDNESADGEAPNP